MTQCTNCERPARELVTYVSQRTGQPTAEPVPMCAVHVQRELLLGASNLSMVDITLTPLPVSE